MVTTVPACIRKAGRWRAELITDKEGSQPQPSLSSKRGHLCRGKAKPQGGYQRDRPRLQEALACLRTPTTHQTGWIIVQLLFPPCKSSLLWPNKVIISQGDWPWTSVGSYAEGLLLRITHNLPTTLSQAACVIVSTDTAMCCGDLVPSPVGALKNPNWFG